MNILKTLELVTFKIQEFINIKDTLSLEKTNSNKSNKMTQDWGLSPI